MLPCKGETISLFQGQYKIRKKTIIYYLIGYKPMEVLTQQVAMSGDGICFEVESIRILLLNVSTYPTT